MKKHEPKEFKRLGASGETFITRLAMQGIVNANSCYPEASMKELDAGRAFNTFLATYQRMDLRKGDMPVIASGGVSPENA